MSMFISPRGVHRYRATHAALSVPVISSLSGTPRDEDLGAFTMTVTGTGFIPTSVVQWDGSARATTYVSPTSLTAAILSGDVDDAGTFAVTVNSPGAGVSNSSTFTVDAAGASDPYFANVVSLMHGEGANGGTTYTDQIVARTWTATGTVTTSTDFPTFGTTSLKFANSSSHLDSDSSADFAFGTGDFTIELFHRTPASYPAFYFVFDGRTGDPQLVPCLYMSSDVLIYHVNGATRITGTTNLTISTIYHIALSRVSGTTRLFLNGVQQGSDYTDGNSYATTRMRLNENGNGGGNLGALTYDDEWRVTKGVGRYSGSFTPPAAPFPDS